MERETGLNKDAGETIERLEWEARELAKATEGQDEKLASVQAAAQDAAGVLQDREAELSEKTEDVARLAARHQSAQRLFEDMKKTVERSEASAVAARQSAEEAEEKLSHVAQLLDEAKTRSETAVAAAAQSEQALATIEQARSVTQSREADARAERSEAEGETNAIRAEVTALAKLVERDTAEGGQIIDRLQVEKGFEKALGAALADDLRAPEVDVDGPTGWAVLPAYGQDQQLPDGVTALSQH
ncbi:MAG: chromosome segregation protein SMC, partial [Paracoccaceae bacterium]